MHRAHSPKFRACSPQWFACHRYDMQRIDQDRALTPHGITVYEETEVQQLMESAGFTDVGITHASDKHRKFMCVLARQIASADLTSNALCI